MKARPRRFDKLCAVLLAQPTAHEGGAVLVQLALVVLWHGTMLLVLPRALAPILGGVSSYWRATDLAERTLRDIGYMESPLLYAQSLYQTASWPGITLVEGTVAYVLFRWLARPARLALAAFARSWWQTCLWGSLILPIGVLAIGLLPATAFEWVVGLAVPAYLVLGPTLYARAGQRLDLPRTRWRPVCPECGYSLRGLRSERCPECGVAFPNAARSFRRWAVRRVAWDRVVRGNLLVAYIQTLLTGLFCPCRAARGLAVPDRLPRAWRWAAAHLVLLAALRAPFALEVQSTVWWQTRLLQSWAPSVYDVPTYDPPVPSLIAWTAQSFIAWLGALATFPLLGILIGTMVPGRHPAARRGIVKWSLYTSGIAVLAHVLCMVLPMTVLLAQRTAAPLAMRIDHLAWLLRVVPHFTFLLVPYALWWAAGVSVNPYLRRRGRSVFVVHAALFVGAWLLAAHLLFPLGTLWYLL